MELSKAELEQLERLGGVDPQWLKLANLLNNMLLGRPATPHLVPGQVASDAAQLLVSLSEWLRPRD